MTEGGPPRGGIVGAIPARFASTRLPGKPLLEIGGKPMIEHVVRRVEAVRGLDRVVVLTDDERIFDAVRGFGAEVEMTPADCVSGTDRIAHAARGWDCRAVINIQGDEPLIEPEGVERLVALFGRGEGAAEPAGPSSPDEPDEPPRTVEMATLSAPLAPELLDDPNKVKVVRALDGSALYFSRAAIPYPRGAAAVAPRLHIGIYGYRRDVLLRLARLAPTPLEQSESLEQLRALENGIRIQVLEVDHAVHPGVDTADDLERVARLLAESASAASGPGVARGSSSSGDR